MIYVLAHALWSCANHTNTWRKPVISWLESADRADIEHATRLRIVLVFVAELAISSHLAQLQNA